MNKLKYILFALVFITSLSSNAADESKGDYKIELCRQEMPLLGHNFPIKIFHLYLKGSYFGDVINAIGFHTQNWNDDLVKILSGQNVKSEIHRGLRETMKITDTCKVILATDEFESYGVAWQLIDDVFNRNSHTPYNLFNLNDGKRCDMLIREAVNEMGIEYPWGHINALREGQALKKFVEDVPHAVEHELKKVVHEIGKAAAVVDLFKQLRF